MSVSETTKMKTVKRHPHTASQVVVMVLTLVAVKVVGQDITDHYAWILPIIAPVIVAKINERWTVPWREVLGAFKELEEAKEGDGFRARVALTMQGTKNVM